MRTRRITIHRFGVTRPTTKLERVLALLPILWLAIWVVAGIVQPFLLAGKIAALSPSLGWNSTIGLVVMLGVFIVLRIVHDSVSSRADDAYLAAINGDPEAFDRYMAPAHAGLDATQVVHRDKFVFVSDEFLFPKEKIDEPDWVSPE